MRKGKDVLLHSHTWVGAWVWGAWFTSRMCLPLVSSIEKNTQKNGGEKNSEPCKEEMRSSEGTCSGEDKRESDMKTQLKERTEYRKGRPSVMSSGKEAALCRLSVSFRIDGPVCFSLCVPELQQKNCPSFPSAHFLFLTFSLGMFSHPVVQFFACLSQFYSRYFEPVGQHEAWEYTLSWHYFQTGSSQSLFSTMAFNWHSKRIGGW